MKCTSVICHLDASTAFRYVIFASGLTWSFWHCTTCITVQKVWVALGTSIGRCTSATLLSVTGIFCLGAACECIILGSSGLWYCEVWIGGCHFAGLYCHEDGGNMLLETVVLTYKNAHCHNPDVHNVTVNSMVIWLHVIYGSTIGCHTLFTVNMEWKQTCGGQVAVQIWHHKLSTREVLRNAINVSARRSVTMISVTYPNSVHALQKTLCLSYKDVLIMVV